MLGTYGLFSLPVNFPLVVAGFCGTSLVYLADRVWTSAPEDRFNRPGRVAWIRVHPRWLATETAVFFALGGAMLPYLSRTTLLGTGVLGGIATYHVLFRRRAEGAFRGIPKPVVIAGMWAAGGALLPLLEAGRPLSVGMVLFISYRGLFILPNPLLADWADRAGDAAAGLAPWAAGWTGRQVRWMATAALLAAGAGAGVWALVGATPVLIGIDALGLLLMTGVVWGLDPTQSRGALLMDLVVGWPLAPALAAWMIV